MESNIYSTKQIKLFGKIYQEFLDNYNTALGVEKKVFKVKKTQILQNYLADVQKNKEDFLDCKESCLSSIGLLKDIDASNTKINWEYLHNLFWVVCKNKTAEDLERSKKGIESSKNALVVAEPEIESLSSSIQGLLSSDVFGNLLKDMSMDVGKMLEGQDLSKINPAELLSGLMDSNNSTKTVGGINFSQIINKTVSSLQEKIENKEIDIEDLRETASSIAGSLNIQKQ